MASHDNRSEQSAESDAPLDIQTINRIESQMKADNNAVLNWTAGTAFGIALFVALMLILACMLIF